MGVVKVACVLLRLECWQWLPNLDYKPIMVALGGYTMTCVSVT